MLPQGDARLINPSQTRKSREEDSRIIDGLAAPALARYGRQAPNAPLQGQRRIPEVYLDAGRLDPGFRNKRSTAACASS